MLVVDIVVASGKVVCWPENVGGEEGYKLVFQPKRGKNSVQETTQFGAWPKKGELAACPFEAACSFLRTLC